MATTPFSLVTAAKAQDRGVRSHFVDVYKEVDPQIEKMLQVRNQDDYQQEEVSYTGIGALQVITEASRYPEDAPIQAYSTTYTAIKRGGVIPLTWEKGKWDKSEIASPRKMTESEAKAMARRNGIDAASIFVNGQNTAYTSLTDAKPLFSVSHPRADGGTAQSNASATGLTLTESNLETGMLAAEQVLDNRGQLIECYVDTLLIPPALRKKALIIARSEARSNTADNDLNVYSTANSMEEFQGLTIRRVLINHYLAAYAGGSDTAWVLMDKTKHAVNWLWGEKPMVGELDETSGNLNDIVYWKVRAEYSTGWNDWRYVWRSAGDGAAYAS